MIRLNVHFWIFWFGWLGMVAGVDGPVEGGKSRFENSSRRARRIRSTRSILPLLSSTALVSVGPAFAQSALPTAGAVVSGSAAISSPSASSLLVTQSSANAIINWGSFSIGAGNAVRFENGTGATLNRVTGFSASQIDGSLSASGSLYLVNPNGITVGPGGTVTTGGSFIASTHDVSDAEFRAGGAMTFKGASSASVINYGTIGSLGGDVALIARKVENAGTITAPNGTVALAAGYEVLARDAALSDGKFVVKVGGADTQAKTSGVIKAAEVELKANGGNVYALAGNTGSITKATGVATKGGRIFLTAGDGGAVTVSQKMSARTAASGGKAKGGEIRVSGGAVKVSSQLDAAGDGDAGGTIVVTGKDVQLAAGADLDARGTTGGVVLVGGDYQGGTNAATKYLAETVATAQTTTVEAGATIRVDGTTGAGGRAVVWSDALTAFNGTITATAAGSGDGGRVETSGHVLSLGPDLLISTRAEQGATGTWLIDPYNITISGSGSSNISVDFSDGSVTPNGTGANINASTLSAYLGTNNITLRTNGAGAEAGNITVNAAVTWSSGTTLTLNADPTTGGVFINAAITGTNAASGLVLSAGSGGISQTAAIRAGTVTATAANGGAVTLTNSGNLVATLGASSAEGSFAFTNAQALTVSGPIASNGILSLTTTAGNLTVSGALNDSHANSSLSLSAAGALIITKDITQSGANASVSLAYGSSYAVTGGRLSLADAGASLTINGQAYTLIRDVTGLQAIGSSGFYALAGDIDASASASWNGGAGFLPVASFNGNLAGLGHVIDGLTINRPGSSDVGLFGLVNGASVQDFTLSNVAITGLGRVGAVAGEVYNSLFSNLHVTGRVTAQQEVGGIVGWFSDSTLTNASSAASVTAPGSDVGGLAGRINYTDTISDSYATGVVSGAANVGGLIGNVTTTSSLTLSNVYASGRVTGPASAAGLIGNVDTSSVTLTNAYWDANSTGQAAAVGTLSGSSVTGTAVDVAAAPRVQSSYGGFDFANTWVLIPGETRPMLRSEYSTVIATPAALQLMSLDLSASYSLMTNIDMTSALAVGGNGYYGGLWGAAGFVPVGNNGAQFTGSFNGQGHTITGLTINRGSTDYVGLFGYAADATIANVVLSGGSITGNDNVGPLIGFMAGGSVTSVSASATVATSSTAEANTGGLIGTVYNGAVSDASATGNVTGAGYNVGGLVGSLVQGGTITRSFATGNVTGTSPGAGNIGGLVGGNGSSGGNGGTISQSYATGVVTGSSGAIGGFVGHNEGTISDSYATGAVIGSGSSAYAGSFVGLNFTDGVITSSYATGYVTGASQVGGFAGLNAGSSAAFTSDYWDVQTSGQSVGVGGGLGSATGRTTAQLQGSLPAGFSSAVWGTGTHLFPYLTWRYTTTPVAISGVAYADAGTTTLAGASVTAVSGGNAIGSGSSGADGTYYILAPASSLASGGVLTYLDNGAQRGAAFSDVVGLNGVQGVSLYANAAHLITGATGLTATRTNYLATRGSYADTDLSFLSGSSFAPLTTVAGFGVYLNASAASYAINANLASSGGLALDSGGAFTVSGLITLAAAGAVSIADAVSLTGSSSLSLTTTGGGNISLGGAVTGSAGTLIVSAAGTATTSSTVDVGTFRLAGGTWRQVAATLPGFTAGNFVLDNGVTFLRATGGDGSAATPYAITDIYGLQGLASTGLLSQHFVLGADIDASPASGWNSGAGFLSIGDATTAFTGSLDGGGHAITNLAVNRPTISAGLFGTIGASGTVSNLVVSGTVTGLNAGLLAGANAGTINGVITSGSVGHAGAVSAGSLGGVVGSNSGSITASASSATVSATDGSAVGGLVGSNAGTVSGSFAGGAVSAGGSGRAGGLAGSNTAVITNSYATGAVSGGATAGGLVGDNAATGTVSYSYATGTVPTAASPNGGLIGTNAGTVQASFWDTTTSGTSLGVGIGASTGVTGLTTAAMSSLSTYAGAGWDIDDSGGTAAVWRIYDGHTRPLLRSFMTGLTVTGGTGTKSYDGTTTTANVGTLTYSPPGYTTSLVQGTAVYTAGSANVGGYSGAGLSLSGLYSSQLGYDITFVAGSLTINSAALTVTANNQSMTSGAAVPPLTYTITNGTLYGSDSLTGMLATAATSASAAGSYAITQGTLAASANYALTYLPGTLTVTGNSQPSHQPSFQPAFIEMQSTDQTGEAWRTMRLVNAVRQPGPSQSGVTPGQCRGGSAGARCGLMPVPGNLPTGPWLSFGTR